MVSSHLVLRLIRRCIWGTGYLKENGDGHCNPSWQILHYHESFGCYWSPDERQWNWRHSYFTLVTIEHVLSGKTYVRAVRGHLLIHTSLTVWNCNCGRNVQCVNKINGFCVWWICQTYAIQPIVLCLLVGLSKQKCSSRQRLLQGFMLCESICKPSFGRLLVKPLLTQYIGAGENRAVNSFLSKVIAPRHQIICWKWLGASAKKTAPQFNVHAVSTAFSVSWLA